jgi:hypothetical protein
MYGLCLVGKSWEHVDVDWSIALRWILDKEHLGRNWVRLAQDRDNLWALVNTVMNL